MNMYRLLIILFFILALLCKVGAYFADGVLIWLSLLSLGIWGILAGNIVLLLIQWVRRKNFWGWSLPLVAVLMHLDFILAVFQPFPSSCKVEDFSEGKSLKIITYNTEHFYPKEKQRTLYEAVETLKELNPDILCMQEAPNTTGYQEDSIKAAFSQFPYTHKTSRNDHTPLLICSHYPLSNIQELYFKNTTNASLVADVDVDGQMFRLFCNHLQTTSVNANRGKIQEKSKPWSFRLKAGLSLILQMKENFRMRKEQADYMAHLIQESPYPVIVCGDFNDMPSSYTYHRMKGDLTDSFREAGSGYQYTFRGIKRLLRIDYIFHTDEFQGVRCYSPDYPYSDHNMVVWEGFLK